jgi:hypothetical protein
MAKAAEDNLVKEIVVGGFHPHISVLTSIAQDRNDAPPALVDHDGGDDVQCIPEEDSSERGRDTRKESPEPQKFTRSEPETETAATVPLSEPNESFSFEINLLPSVDDVSPLSCQDSVIAAMLKRSVYRALDASPPLFREVRDSPKLKSDRNRIRTASYKRAVNSRERREGQRGPASESSDDDRRRKKHASSSDDRRRRKSKERSSEDRQRHRSRSKDGKHIVSRDSDDRHPSSPDDRQRRRKSKERSSEDRRRHRSRSKDRKYIVSRDSDDLRRRRRRSRSRAPSEERDEGRSRRSQSHKKKSIMEEIEENNSRRSRSRRGSRSRALSEEPKARSNSRNQEKSVEEIEENNSRRSRSRRGARSRAPSEEPKARSNSQNQEKSMEEIEENNSRRSRSRRGSRSRAPSEEPKGRSNSQKQEKSMEEIEENNSRRSRSRRGSRSRAPSEEPKARSDSQNQSRSKSRPRQPNADENLDNLENSSVLDKETSHPDETDYDGLVSVQPHIAPVVLKRTLSPRHTSLLADAKESGYQASTKWAQIQGGMERVQSSPFRAVVADVKVSASQRNSSSFDEPQGHILTLTVPLPVISGVVAEAKENGAKSGSKWAALKVGVDQKSSSGRQETGAKESVTKTSSEWDALQAARDLKLSSRRQDTDVKESRTKSSSKWDALRGGMDTSSDRDGRERQSESRKGGSKWDALKGGNAFIKQTRKRASESRQRPSRNRESSSSKTSSRGEKSKWNELRGGMDKIRDSKKQSDGGSRRRQDVSKWDALKNGNTFIKSTQKKVETSRQRRSVRSSSRASKDGKDAQQDEKPSDRDTSRANEEREVAPEKSRDGVSETPGKRNKPGMASKWDGLRGGVGFITETKRKAEGRRRRRRLGGEATPSQETPVSSSDTSSKWGGLQAAGLSNLKESKDADAKDQLDTQFEPKSTQGKGVACDYDGYVSVQPKIKPVLMRNNNDNQNSTTGQEGNTVRTDILTSAETLVDTSATTADAPGVGALNTNKVPVEPPASKWGGLNNIISDTKKKAKESRRRRAAMGDRSVDDVSKVNSEASVAPRPSVASRSQAAGDGMLVTPKLTPVVLSKAYQSGAGRDALIQEANEETEQMTIGQGIPASSSFDHERQAIGADLTNLSPQIQMASQATDTETRFVPEPAKWDRLRKANDLITEKRKSRENSRARQKHLDSLNFETKGSQLHILPSLIETNAADSRPASRNLLDSAMKLDEVPKQSEPPATESRAKRRSKWNGLREQMNYIQEHGKVEHGTKWAGLKRGMEFINKTKKRVDSNSGTGRRRARNRDAVTSESNDYPGTEAEANSSEKNQVGTKLKDLSARIDTGDATKKPSKWAGLKGGIDSVNKKTKQAADDSSKATENANHAGAGTCSEPKKAKATLASLRPATGSSSERATPKSMWNGLRGNLRHEKGEGDISERSSEARSNKRLSKWGGLKGGMDFISRAKRQSETRKSLIEES